ncbi:MAG: hypothetical protein IT162_22780 [Bryobacterales bacterium]|nr:hypothetical protein [Bryobacterales bacterium]
MKITPILFVEAIEPALPFWTDRAGFTKTVEVPDGNRLGFAILEHEGAEVMLQTWSSAEQDSESAGRFARASRVPLFIEVPDFAAVLQRLGDWPVTMPVRDTFYGMREIGVEAPGGHLVVFAARLG